MWKHDAIRFFNKVGLGGPVSRLVINDYAGSTTPRPRPFSMWSAVSPALKSDPDYVSDYTTWPGLTDKKFSGRHLSPASADYIARLPYDLEYDAKTGQMGDITALFARQGAMKPSRSSALFAFFAQWFTDSLLRFDGRDRRRNTSNHDIDLCQIYGLCAATTDALRTKVDGRLKSQLQNGEELLPPLCEPDGAGAFRLRAEYRPQGPRCSDPNCTDPRFTDCRNWPLGYDDAVVDEFLALSRFPKDRKGKFYATGLERGNSSIGYVAISTIFMREHNRLAAGLKARNPGWNDERLFQTARNINIVILMKLVVEDYINHILGAKLFRLEAGHFEDKPWYRPNWITAEFDLLYRWHGLMPDTIRVGGADLPHMEYRNNNARLEQAGLAAVIDAASRQAAGCIGLRNTPDFLWGAEYQAIKMGRDFRLRSFNEYRERFGLGRCKSFEELTDDAALREELEKRYRNIDDVEYVVGIFAEKQEKNALFGRLLTHMVAYDAFTQIFSNPLLAKEIHNAATFTKWGLEEIERTDTIQELVDRNLKSGTTALASLTAPKA